MAAMTLHPRILVVEDDIGTRRLMEFMLRNTGATVITAENGQVAVEIASRESFDLILMDVRMPVMDGIEATRILREKGAIVPILAMTATTSKEDREQTIAAGCNGYVDKLLGADELLAAIKSIVQDFNK